MAIRPRPAEPAAAEPQLWAPSLMRDLQLVAAYYQCPPDELALMVECARANPVSARNCFRLLAREIG